MDDPIERLRILGATEAIDARNVASIHYIDRCQECGREFSMHLIIPHHDSCDIPKRSDRIRDTLLKRNQSAWQRLCRLLLP